MKIIIKEIFWTLISFTIFVLSFNSGLGQNKFDSYNSIQANSIVDSIYLVRQVENPQQYKLDYYENGLLKNLTIEQYDLYNGPQTVRKQFSYDFNNNIISEIYERNNVFIWRKSFSYNNDNHLILYLLEGWVNQEWVKESRTTYVLNPNGKTDIILYENWNDNKLENSTQKLYSYNELDQLVSIEYQDWNNENWSKISKNIFVYQSDKVSSEIIYLWNGEDWQSNWKTTFQYANSGKDSIIVEEYSDGQNFYNRTRKTNNYNINNFLQSTLYEESNDTGWNYTYKELYEYDENGNNISYLKEHWDGENWVNSARFVQTFDANNNIIQFESEFWDGSIWKPLDYEYKFKDKNGNNLLMICASCSFYYKNITSNIDEKNKIEIFKLLQNYPNPFNPKTIIEYSIPNQTKVSIKIYDLLGNEILTLINEEKGVGSYSLEFDGSKLSSGIYLYKMQTSGYTDTKKLLLLK
ncbi:MAG: T9SS type A sorting domain-containing protein [Ignavibacteriae bacterium]|nr:T9SS type A sorting domain-containing protein [Ignavibacteriota bacterium]